MWNPARSQQRLARSKPLSAVPNLKQHLALHHVKPLFLVQVKVERRAAVPKVHMLNDQQTTIRLARHDFEENRTES
jgi:hypothetical protein